jgi:hypothetical protein
MERDEGCFSGSVAKNILATFCSSDELMAVITSCMVSEFLQQSRHNALFPFGSKFCRKSSQTQNPPLVLVGLIDCWAGACFSWPFADHTPADNQRRTYSRRRQIRHSRHSPVQVPGHALGQIDLEGRQRIPLVGPAIRLWEHQKVLVGVLIADAGKRRVRSLDCLPGAYM